MRSLVLSLALGVACFAQEPTAQAPMRISSSIMAAHILTQVIPVLPDEAKRQRVNGLVVMYAIIGKDGLIKDLRVISGPKLLRPNFLDAVRQWTYKPYLLNGVPVVVATTISLEIEFGG